MPRWPQRTLAERFEEKVDRSPGLGPGGDCHHWTATTVRGYGWIGLGAAALRGAYAHRVAWFIATGEWPTLNVLHECDNPPCVNPAHLFLGTQADNVADMHEKGRASYGLLRGESNGNAIPVDAVAVCAASGTHREIAERFGLSRRTIGRIRNGEHWSVR